MIEKSKTFKRLAKIAGFAPERLLKTHRGIVARMALPLIEEYELKEFEKKMKRIDFRKIPVREYGVITHYV